MVGEGGKVAEGSRLRIDVVSNQRVDSIKGLSPTKGATVVGVHSVRTGAVSDQDGLEGVLWIEKESTYLYIIKPII